ncbi:MAG: hypothetical protein CVU46_11460 [Chloroflexi bacterium HGW-Chloroflexi-8]|nr:MAG: hypothetical protein CVU46_11460 [Chloroflexi bacterium HGW-Chloroflexi-8]
MKTKNRILIGIGGILLVCVILILAIPRKVNIKINGQEQFIFTRSWTVEKVLETGGLSIKPEDQITPSLQKFMFGVDEIKIELAREVIFTNFPNSQSKSLLSADRNLNNLINQSGILISPQDRITVNQKPVKLSDTLPYSGAFYIDIKKAVEIKVSDGEKTSTIQSSADTLMQALADANIQVAEKDWMNLPGDTPLNMDLQVIIRRAQPITIQLKDDTFTFESASSTVGEILADAGVSLQSLDYSIPSETSMLGEDKNIQVIRVREEIEQIQTPIAFTNEYIQSDQVELDQTDVVVPGEFGLEVTRTRIRYEDDQEISRTEAVTWVAKQPVSQQIGRGTQVVVRTMDTPQGEIEYWRSVNVYATSYSPCRSAADRCYYGTASGLPVQQGVVSVSRSWYNLMVGQRIYVPNYGIATIADVGGGVSGKYWIDLGYSDDDYVAWYSNVTIYFLTPVPDNIPWILP